jgi:hypothetical protein
MIRPTRTAGLIALLVAANAVMAARVITRHADAAAANLPGLPTLAGQRAVDGRAVDIPVGAPAVLAFVSDGSDEMLRPLHGWLTQSRFTLVAFARTARHCRTLLAFRSAYCVAGAQVQVPSDLRPTSGLNTWLLYDGAGARRGDGIVEHGGLESALGGLLGKIPEYSALLVRELLDPIVREGALRHLQPTDSPAGVRHHALFVSQPSSACPIIDTLRAIDRRARTSGEGAYSILVPSDWSDADVETFARNFDLAVRVERADRRITAVWRRLANTYGYGEVLGFLMALESGRLAEVYTSAMPVIAQL